MPPHTPTPASAIRFTRIFRENLWPHGDRRTKQRVLLSLGLLLGGKALNVQVPYIFKAIVDTLEPHALASASASSFWMQSTSALFVGYLAARTGSSFFQEFKNVIFSRISQKSIRSVSLESFKHLLELDHAFHLARNTGTISKAIDRATKGVGFLLNSTVFNIAPTLIELGLVSSIVGLRFGWAYAAISLATVASYTAYTFSMGSWRARIRRTLNSAENAAAGVALDALVNHESVKAFNSVDVEVARYDTHLKAYADAQTRTSQSLCWLNFGQNAIFGASITGMMWMVATGVGLDATTVATAGDLVLLNGLLLQLSHPLNFLGSIYREFRQALVDIETMNALLATQSQVRDEAPNCALDAGAGAVSFNDVSFAYPAAGGAIGRPTLQRLSFVVPAGATVAFVGHSGCGKSTIARLLLRFYDCDAGNIAINGQNVRRVSLRSLRQAIAVVPQDIPLFNASIFHNIAYGSEHASAADVEAAARAVGIHAFISSLPKRYETIVGERGLLLSGGERQRIALARAILKDAPILLLDEATASLDAHTEAAFMRFVESSKRARKTVLMIAHRLSTVTHADCIVVLGANGRIVEQGTHQQLLSIENGAYRNLWLSSTAERK